MEAHVCCAVVSREGARLAAGAVDPERLVQPNADMLLCAVSRVLPQEIGHEPERTIVERREVAAVRRDQVNLDERAELEDVVFILALWTLALSIIKTSKCEARGWPSAWCGGASRQVTPARTSSTSRGVRSGTRSHKRWHDSLLASRVPETNPVIETPVLETAVGDDRECGLLVPHRRSQSIVLR